MNIIIGKLGNQPFPITESSVSRHHAELIVNEMTGKMVLHDTNSVNGTYVMDSSGKFCRIKQTAVGMDTVVRVGANVTFKVRDLFKKDEEKASIDISRLKYVYNSYNQNKMQLETATGNIMMLRIGAMSLGTTLSGLLFTCLPKDMLGDETTTIVLKSLSSLLILVISWLLVSAKNNSLIQRKYQNEEYFKKKYRCPKCGYSFGMRIYDNLIAEGKCPNPSCRCKFVEKN